VDERTKELVAIGASVGSHCQPCLAYHIDKARDSGVANGDIQEAVNIGFMIGKGGENAMRKYAMGIISEDNKGQAGPCCSGGDSNCCGGN